MLPAARGCRPSGFPLCFSSVPCACCRCRSVRLTVPAAAVFLPLMISEKVYAVLASLFFVMHHCLKHLFLCVSSCSVSLPVLCLLPVLLSVLLDLLLSVSFLLSSAAVCLPSARAAVFPCWISPASPAHGAPFLWGDGCPALTGAACCGSAPGLIAGKRKDGPAHGAPPWISL